MHVRTTAAELARWIERQGGVWTVEGEPALARTLPSPAPASALVEVLRRREGHLAILAPEACSLPPDVKIGAAEITLAAHDVGGNRVLQLARIEDDGTTRDSWLIAEDVAASSRDLARTPEGGVSASAVVEAWRAGLRLSAPEIRRKVN